MGLAHAVLVKPNNSSRKADREKAWLASEPARRIVRRRQMMGVASGVACAAVYLGREPTLDLCGGVTTCQLRVGAMTAVAFWALLGAALFLVLTKPARPTGSRR